MESTPEQAAEGMLIVRVLAAVLDRLIDTNASLSRSHNMQDPAMIVTKFHAMKPPGISIQLYLERYVATVRCSVSSNLRALKFLLCR